MMSRHNDNIPQRKRNSVVRRVQKKRRNILNHVPPRTTKTTNAKALRKFKKNLRLEYLNAPRVTRQVSHETGVWSRDDDETTRGRTAISPPSPPRTIRVLNHEMDDAFLPRRSSRLLGTDQDPATENLRDPDFRQGIVTRQRRNRTLAQMDSVPQRRGNGNLQLRSRRSLLEPKLSSSSSSEYESDDSASSTGSCSSESTVWAHRRTLRSRATHPSKRPGRITRLQQTTDPSALGQTHSERRITRSNPQFSDFAEVPNDIADASNEGEKYSSQPRTTRRTRRLSHTVDPSLDDTQGVMPRKSIRLFLRNPPVRPQEIKKQSPPQAVLASSRQLRASSRAGTKQSRIDSSEETEAHVVESEGAGGSFARHASHRQLFDRNLPQVKVNDESRPVRRRGRPRKVPIKETDEVEACQRRKRGRDEALTPVRRSNRVKTPPTKKARCLRSCRSRFASGASIGAEIADVEESSTFVPKKPSKFLPETPERRARRARLTKSTANGVFTLQYEALTNEYEAMASVGQVKSVRFGATIEMAQQAVERSIRLYESRATLVDQDILADEKQHRKSLKSHASFEAQEQMNLIEDVEVEVNDDEGEQGRIDMEELADRPILTSQQVRIGSRKSRCNHKDCPLCLPHSQVSEQSKLPGTTITPNIHSISGSELNDGIVKNTLNALKRLRYSLAFVKENS